MSTGGNKLMLAYYGDDFTGSTDALDFLSRAGIKTALFISPPSAETLARYDGLGAIGVAGMSRSMNPDEMDAELRPIFKALKALNVRHVHYKVCSTFDSSPNIGSIGRAIDIGADVFKRPFVPLLVAAPALGRYCAFGNLFARMGIGSEGGIYRLDRHPSMSKHPTTPADESDLAKHLSKQTAKVTGLINILDIEMPTADVIKKLEAVVASGDDIVLFDAIYEHQLTRIGQVIDQYAETEPLFSAGSSGIEMALGNYWKDKGDLPSQPHWPESGKAEPLLVISGSCSPVTSQQMEYALANGFAEIALDTTALANDYSTQLIEECATMAAQILQTGKSLVIHTSRGPGDIRIVETAAAFVKKGLVNTQALTAKLYGTALGEIAKLIVAQTNIRRIVIAGGDTSSFAARAMGIEAVEMIAPLSPGAPLCKAFAPGSPVDGLEVNFKGGQVGREDYFLLLLGGK